MAPVSERSSDAPQDDSVNIGLSPKEQQTNGQRPRRRASVACTACRERRIRCRIPPGLSGCDQCSRSGVQCVIKYDDERRR